MIFRRKTGVGRVQAIRRKVQALSSKVIAKCRQNGGKCKRIVYYPAGGCNKGIRGRNSPNQKYFVIQNAYLAIAIDMRTSPGQDSIYTMSGIAVCVDCGALMTRKASTVSGKKYVYYLCSNHKKFKRCTSHRIREDELEETVLSTLKELIGQLLDADEVIRQAGEMQIRRIDIQKMEERIQANEEEINRYNRMLVSLYEDYKEGIVDKKDFQLIKENFEQKKTIAEQAIRNIEKEAEQAAQERDSDRSWIEEYRENRNISSLTRSLVVNLIREVRVYEKGNLEIVLDCDDKFHSMLEQAARIQNIEKAERMAV